MVERLKLYIETKGMIASQFADAIGMPRSSFSQLLTGRNKSISDATIGKIHAAFPDLSISWLLFGEGAMLARMSVMDVQQVQQQPQLSIFGENEVFAGNAEDDEKYGKEIEVDKLSLAQGMSESKVASEPPVSFYHARPIAHNNNKSISKIMVFYSDNTYETFIPE